MKHRTTWFLLILFLAGSQFWQVAEARRRIQNPTPVWICYSGNLVGNLEPCG
ncbi:hypothetical protein KKG05_10125 [bacterium]|nr:hypothetical protein [bacterium]MBU1937742.1 hypothetical protein [bacterium]